MTTRNTLAHAAAGALLVNAVPHGVAGLIGRAFPSPFADPPGVGLSGRVPNLVWSAANVALGTVLLRGRARSAPEKKILVASGAVTAVALTVYFASLDLDPE